MREFAEDKGHYKCDSSLVIVMAHGDNSEPTETVDFKGFDGRNVNSSEIVKRFMAYNCKPLKGKPKLFFFQACR